jgi:hypothetical protein
MSSCREFVIVSGQCMHAKSARESSASQLLLDGNQTGCNRVMSL